jgi:hypothetical protein
MNPITRKPMTQRRLLTICGGVALIFGSVSLVAGLVTGYRVLVTLGLVSLAVGALWLLCARFACDEPLRAVHRRYLREFFPAIASYFILLFASLSMLKYVHETSLKFLIALLPVLPIVFVIRAMVHFVADSDELERRVQLEAICIASLSVGLLSFAAAFLRAAGLLLIDNALMLVLPALFAFYGVSLVWVKRRYRD